MFSISESIYNVLKPYYKNNGIASISLNDSQQVKINEVKSKIESSYYRLEKNDCLCKNCFEKEDILIAEKDRYGFNISTVICGSCGLVRCGEVFDKKSLTEFYINDYRSIYLTPDITLEKFFNDQRKHGEEFYLFLEKYIDLEKKLCIFDIGCGAGGIMYEFFTKGHTCIGFDYNEIYMEFGKQKGLRINNGAILEAGFEDKCDLVLLSHVMEHFLDPISELRKIIDYVNINGYLLIEVPGIVESFKAPVNPIGYFQNAHIFSFYEDFLSAFFRSLGLKVIYSDDKALFLLKKEREVDFEVTLDCLSLKHYPQKIKQIFFQAYLKHNFFLTKARWIELSVRILEVTGLKSTIKNLLKNKD